MLADLGIEKLVAREANRIMQFCLVTGIVIQRLVGPVLGNKDEPRLMEGTGCADRIPPFYDPFPTARLTKEGSDGVVPLWYVELGYTNDLLLGLVL